MKMTLTLCAVLLLVSWFFVVGCGGGSSEEVSYCVIRSTFSPLNDRVVLNSSAAAAGECEELPSCGDKVDFDSHNPDTYHLVEELCSNGSVVDSIPSPSNFYCSLDGKAVSYSRNWLTISRNSLIRACTYLETGKIPPDEVLFPICEVKSDNLDTEERESFNICFEAGTPGAPFSDRPGVLWNGICEITDSCFIGCFSHYSLPSDVRRQFQTTKEDIEGNRYTRCRQQSTPGFWDEWTEWLPLADS